MPSLSANAPLKQVAMNRRRENHWCLLKLGGTRKVDPLLDRFSVDIILED